MFLADTELISRCSKLQILNISFCNSLFMSGQLLSKSEDRERIAISLENLKELNLSSIRYISDVTFSRLLGVCFNLEKLIVGGNKISFHSDAYYGKADKLNSSLLRFKTVADCIEERAAKMKVLDFSRTNIDDDALLQLSGLDKLVLLELYLVCCRELSTSGVVAMAKAQNKLQVLDLSQCNEIGDGVFRSVCEHLHHMRHLRLNKCCMISDSSIGSIHMLDEMESFEIASNYLITARAFSNSLNKGKLTRLKTLNLSHCTEILRDTFAVALCRNLSMSLVHLDISSSKITDIGLQFICINMVALKSLILQWNSDVTDKGLLGIALDVDVEHELTHQQNGVCKCHRRKMGENVLNLPQVEKKTAEDQRPLGVESMVPYSSLCNHSLTL